MTITRAARWRTRGAIILCLGAGSALAQDNGGVSMEFGVTHRLGAERDDDGDYNGFAETLLDYTAKSETRISSLDFFLGGAVRYWDDRPDSKTGILREPRSKLSYSRQGARSKLTLTGDFARNDLNSLINLPLIDDDGNIPDENDTVRVQERGYRDSYSARILLETGIDSPLGFNLDASHRGRKYRDTISTSYYDNRTNSVSAGARLRFSPVTQGTLQVSESRYDANDDDDTRRDTRSFEFGVTHELDKATRLTANLGHSRIKRTDGQGVDRETDIQKGVIGTVSLERDLLNGSISLDYTRTLSTDGSRNTVNLDRVMEHRLGEFAFGLGASRGDDGDTQMVGDMRYTMQLPRDQFGFSVSHEIRSSESAEDVRVTQASVNWDHALNELSGLNLNMGYTHIDPLGNGDTEERERRYITLNYNHSLTRDWVVNTGVSHSTSDSDDDGNEKDGQIFMSLGRVFTGRY